MAELWSRVAARTTAAEAAQDGPEAEAEEEVAKAAVVVERLAHTDAKNECQTALSHANPPANTKARSQESIAAALAQTSIGAGAADEPPEPILQDFSPSSKLHGLDGILHLGGLCNHGQSWRCILAHVFSCVVM